jgi:hypothetical protein
LIVSLPGLFTLLAIMLRLLALPARHWFLPALLLLSV